MFASLRTTCGEPPSGSFRKKSYRTTPKKPSPVCAALAAAHERVAGRVRDRRGDDPVGARHALRAALLGAAARALRLPALAAAAQVLVLEGQRGLGVAHRLLDLGSAQTRCGGSRGSRRSPPRSRRARARRAPSGPARRRARAPPRAPRRRSRAQRRSTIRARPASRSRGVPARRARRSASWRSPVQSSRWMTVCGHTSTPASLKTSLPSRLSMATAAAATPPPTYGMPLSSSAPSRLPSSPPVPWIELIAASTWRSRSPLKREPPGEANGAPSRPRRSSQGSAPAGASLAEGADVAQGVAGPPAAVAGEIDRDRLVASAPSRPSAAAR